MGLLTRSQARSDGPDGVRLHVEPDTGLDAGPDAGLDRADLSRAGAAMAALGAGIVALGVAGPVLHGAGPALPAPVAGAVALLAAGQLAWSLWALRAWAVPRPRAAAVASALAVAGWLALAPALPATAHGGRTSAELAAALSGAAGLGAALSWRWQEGRRGHGGVAAGAPQLRPALVVAVLLVVALAWGVAVADGLASGPAGAGASMPGM